MPFDAMTMSATTDEIRVAIGGQIQRIIQPSTASIALSVYAGGVRRWLLLSADARYARVHLCEEALAKGFATPSSFVMLLRKYLEGGRLVSVDQVPYERILSVSAESGAGSTRLVAEVMGKHS